MIDTKPCGTTAHVQLTARDTAQIKPDAAASHRQVRNPSALAIVLVLDSDEFGVAEEDGKSPQHLQISQVRMALLDASVTVCYIDADADNSASAVDSTPTNMASALTGKGHMVACVVMPAMSSHTSPPVCMQSLSTVMYLSILLCRWLML